MKQKTLVLLTKCINFAPKKQQSVIILTILYINR